MIFSAEITGNNIRNLVVMLGLGLLLGACAKSPPLLIHANYYGDLEQQAISRQIDRLESVIDKNPHKQETYFRLATLYSHPSHQYPDYHRALNMLNRYLSLKPDVLKYDEVLYMKNLLGEIIEARERQEQLALEAQQLKELNEALKRGNAKLAEENHSLNDAIEKLKQLELRLEERRLHLK